MFCQKCGKELADGVRFCTACGAPVERPAFRGVQQSVTPPAEPQKIKYEDEVPEGNGSGFSSPEMAKMIYEDYKPADEPVTNIGGLNSVGAAPDNTYVQPDNNIYSNADYSVNTPSVSNLPDDGNGGKKKNIALPIAICAIICTLAALAVVAFYMNWFGVADRVNDLFGNGTSQSEDKDSSKKKKDKDKDDDDKDSIDDVIGDDVDNTTTTTTTTTETTTTTTATTTTTTAPANAPGSEINPVIANGAPQNVACRIDAAKQCTIKFTPAKTGYYYIQIPVSAPAVTFKVYDGSGNLMGSSEGHKEGKVNENLYYDMFYAGQTYKISAVGKSEGDFKISFTDRTNDKHRVVEVNKPLKNLTNKYTYLRTFTPSSTGNYTVAVSPVGNAGTVKLYDANWTPITLTLTDNGNGSAVCTQQFTGGQKYHFVIDPSGTLTFSVTQ